MCYRLCKKLVIKNFIAFLLSLLVLQIVFELIKREIKHDVEVTRKLNQIDSLIQHRTHLDSLYWDHLEKCAFELREGIEIKP